MFTLKKDIPQLYQWDSNVKLIVEDDRINQVQFSQRFSRTAVCVKVENRECFIPNEFLQSYYDIFAYACIVDNDGQVCEFSEMFTVFARPKPDNYIYTPTEIITFKRIEDELNKKFEALAKEIEDDMKTAVRTRPQELTEEEKSQARKNIGAISSEEDRGAYYITITEDENGYISDRTFDDISHAINNNLFPYIIYNLSLYPWISIANETLIFGGILDESFTEIRIMSDNSIIINSHNYSPDWEDQEYDDGFIKNRTHGKVVYKCDTEEKVPTSISGARELTDSQETYLQSIGANTESSKELSFVLPGNDVFYDRMSNEYDYDNYEPPNESNTKIQIVIQDSSGIITSNPSFTVSEIKTNDILYGWSFNFTDGGFAENYLKCIVMLLKNVPYNGYIRKGIWLPNYTGSPKKGYACKIEYTCIKKLEKKYIPDLGNSLPDGGTTGQVLTKNSNADGDAGWTDISGYLSEKLDKNQGVANSGKFLGIGADGIVVPTEVGGSEDQLTGLELIVEHTVTEDENDATSLVFTQESYPKINSNKIFFVYITRTEVGTSPWLDIKAGTQIATSSSQCGNWNWMMFLADGTNGLWLKNWIYTTQSIDTYRVIEPAYYYGGGQIATKNIQFKPYDKITLSSWTAWFKTGMVIKIFGSKTT